MDTIRLRKFGPEGFRVVKPGVPPSRVAKRERDERDGGARPDPSDALVELQAQGSERPRAEPDQIAVAVAGPNPGVWGHGLD